MTPSARDVLIAGRPDEVAQAIARRFLADGDRVTVLTDARGHAADAATFEGLAVARESADLTSADDIARIFAALAARGQLPSVVLLRAPLTAALASPEHPAFERLGPELRAVALLCRAAVPGMRDAGFGRILGVGAAEALDSARGDPEAVAAWAAHRGFLRELAREVAAPWGITVNTLAHGLVREAAPHPAQAALLRRTALGRVGTADEVAGMVRMVCAPAAGYLHGQCLGIDGGLS